MATVLRFWSLEGVTYDFAENEVVDLVEWMEERQLSVESQLGDPTVYAQDIEHYRANITFQVPFASTLARLNLLRYIRDRFWLFPHYLDDILTKYCVVLLNPDEIKERWHRGYPLADHQFTLQFKEFTGAVCYPPEAGS